MNPETTKIFDAAKEVIEQHYNNNTSVDIVGAYIAEDISQAVVEIYGKGYNAKHLLDAIAHGVQSWCNPALNDDDEEDN